MSEPDFKDIMEDIPDWKELERTVEVMRADGSTVVGRVTYEDFSPGPDEHPYLQVEVRGQRFDWFDFEKWRYAPEA